MSIADIKKQLQFRRLMSHIQEIVKLNFASSLKMRIFALVNQQYGLPKRVHFRYSADGETSTTSQKVISRNN